MSESAYAYLRIRGSDLPLDEITTRMGLPPTESWRRGDPGTYNPAPPDAGWCLHSPLVRTELCLDRHIEALLPLLETRAGVLLDLGQSFEVWLQCVGYYCASSPGFHLSRQMLQRVAALQLSIDFDLYFQSEETSL